MAECAANDVYVVFQTEFEENRRYHKWKRIITMLHKNKTRTKSDKFQLLQRVWHVLHEQRIDYEAFCTLLDWNQHMAVGVARTPKSQMHSMSFENGTPYIVIYDAREIWREKKS